MMRICVLCCLMLTCSTAPGQKGPRDYMTLGGSKLALGMPEDTVIAGIAKQGFEIKNLYPDKGDGRSGWLITVPPERVFQLNFVASKLSYISADVGPSDQSAGVIFAEAVFGALKTFEDEGRTFCTIQTGTYAGAGPAGSGANMNAWISCGAKSIEIGISSVDTEKWKFKVATLRIKMGNVN